MADMRSLRGILLDVREKAGELTPATLVEAAKPADHPLHNRFEWDDAVAGHKYRLSQAKKIIQSVKIQFETPGDQPTIVDVRAFVSYQGKSGRPVYEPTDVVRDDPIARQIVLAQARREWLTLFNRYKHLQEFMDMVAQDLGPLDGDGDGEDGDGDVLAG